MAALTVQETRDTVSMMTKPKSAKARNGQAFLRRVCENPRYRGKHLVVVAGRVYVARTSKDLSRLVDRALQRYPGVTPTLVYVPKVESLIL